MSDEKAGEIRLALASIEHELNGLRKEIADALLRDAALNSRLHFAEATLISLEGQIKLIRESLANHVEP